MNTIILIPVNPLRDLIHIMMGLVHSLERIKKRVYFFEPIFDEKRRNVNIEKFLKFTSNKCAYQKIQKKIIGSEIFEKEKILDEIVDIYELFTKDKDPNKICLILGNYLKDEYYLSKFINYEILQFTSAKIIFLTFNDNGCYKFVLKYIEHLKISKKDIFGIINYSSNYPKKLSNKKFLDILYKERIQEEKHQEFKKNFKYFSKHRIIEIKRNVEMISIRSIDISNYLKSNVLNRGEINTRRISSIMVGKRKIFNDEFDQIPNETLIFSSSNDLTTITSVYLLILEGNLKVSTLLITDGLDIDRNLYNHLHRLFYNTYLPVLIVEENLLEITIKLREFDFMRYHQDIHQLKKIRNYVSTHFKKGWIESLIKKEKRHDSISLKLRENISSTIFRHKLINLAKKNKRTIVLPEGESYKIIQAASICEKRGIANCILIGDPKKIQKIAISYDINLKDIKIIDPKLIYHKYIDTLVASRKKKGMNHSIASQQLSKNNILLATMMLHENEVDGLVSGIVNTTADTIRPALQIIKTKPESSIISSIFFMLFPERTIIFGDCAINVNPNSEELSEIAIQSADSAIKFGIIPKIAMVSYSTGYSAEGKSVEKVRSAVEIVRKKRPELIVDGPIQYDAAISEQVANQKSPDSNLSGKATIFIFPNLDTGNVVYKAVQRAANLTSVGPVLQGIRKPVNDLSRGSSIKDIVYTIAATSIQSSR
ncbi:phosphate acetyltransferase [Candidatus Riesia pediculischaeffi]|nr:phosphate acetyltransferase [Candidatus Riesia pediculischaeffi]